MDSNDRHAIDGLFQKLAQVEGQSAPRDGESEAFIRQKIGQQPAAAYYMAQTIVVQEQALNAAQARIEELEREGSEQRSGGGGLLGSLFGGGSSRSRGSVPRTGASQSYGQPAGYQQAQNAAPAGSPWGGAGRGTMGGGGGFLAGAAQTAMGVAGGVLLGNAIGGLFTGDEAQAAEPSNEAAAEDASADAGESFDAGDMGDMEV